LSLTQFFVAFLLAGAALNAEAGIPFMSRTVSWGEDVLQTDGRVLAVTRTITYGADERGRSGRGLPKAQTISFSYNGQQVEWANNDRRQINRPNILDFVSGRPVVVMPVQGWNACDKYGFPQEGLVAFGYQNGSWGRIALASLPKELKVNLLRANEYTGVRITPAIKPGLERGNWESLKQGQSITEASQYYAGRQDSCANIRPLPNPLQDAAKQQNSEVEAHAQTLVAAISSSANSPENISPDDFRKAKGAWTGMGYLSDRCKGIVEGIKPIRLYHEGGGWSLVDYTLVLTNGGKIPFQQSTIKWPLAPEAVTCDKDIIYVVKRQSKDQLTVHRLTPSGTSVDALRLTLPDVTKFFPGEKRPMIWEVLPANGQLPVVIANHSYTRTAELGGILDQRVSYTTQLPQ
jgi:hypothetical protein